MSKKIVITGGPGGGKTTALDLFRRSFPGKIECVPEAATIIFSGGIERTDNVEEIKVQQKAILDLQKNLENIQELKAEDKVIICDRGSLDGLAYWPGTESEFFEVIESSLEKELARYDAVIFFETAASSGQGIRSNNPIRNESEEQAILLDSKLQNIWKQHPHFYFVKSSESFIEKIMFGVNTIEKVMKSF